MSYKVVRDSQGIAIAYGPDDDNYAPVIPIGGSLSIEQASPAPTKVEQFKTIERAIEQYMDKVAKADGWDDRKSISLRAGYAGPWQAKGIKFAQWMDTCWAIAIQAQNDVVAGTRSIPTPEQAIAELPPMVW